MRCDRHGKLKTSEIMYAMLCSKQSDHECLNGDKNPKIFKQATMCIPVTKLDGRIYYRARTIDEMDGEETGIFRKNGIPISGYAIQHSGITPKEKIKEICKYKQQYIPNSNKSDLSFIIETSPLKCPAH